MHRGGHPLPLDAGGAGPAPGTYARMHACRVAVPPSGGAAPTREQARPVRRRRAERPGQALGRRRRALVPDVPRRVRGRPPQPGPDDLVRGAQRAAWVLAERTYSVWPDLEQLHARARPAAVHRRRAPPGQGVRRARRVASPPSSATPTCSSPSTSPASRCTPPTAPRTTRSCSPAATPPSTRSRSPTSSTPPCSATGSRPCCAITELIRKQGRDRAGATQCCYELARTGVAYVPALLRRRLPPRRPDRAGRPQPARRAAAGRQAHRDGPRRVAVPQAAARPARRDGARADERGDLPWLHPRLPVLPGRHDHPAGPRARRSPASARWSSAASTPPGYDEVGLLSLSSADHSEIGEVAKGLADRYDGSKTSLSLPSTRVDAFNVTLAEELARNGRQSGLTFAPEGGSERLRRVINKMVSEEDLIRTVTTAYRRGWRQVKLYFMCGLPTETDEDVLQIAEDGQGGHPGRSRGHRAPRHPVHGEHRRVRAQAPHAVPVGRPARPRDDRPAAAAAQATPSVATGRSASATTMASPASSKACCPAATAGSAAVIEEVVRRGGRFDGWSEHFSYERWLDAAARASASTSTGTRPGSAATPRSCPGTTWTPAWTGSGSGPTGRTRSPRRELDDCRWTPCYDCGVCPAWAPRSRSARPAARCCRSRRWQSLLPRSRPEGAAHRRRSCSDCGSGTPSAAGCASPPPRRRARLRACAPARRRADRLLGRVHPAPEDQLGRRGADRRGQRGRVRRARAGRRRDPTGVAGALDAACRPGSTCWSASSRPVVPWLSGSTRPNGRSGSSGRPVEQDAPPSRRFWPRTRSSSSGCTKDGRRALDARSAVVSAQVRAGGSDGDDQDCAILHLVVGR